MAEPVNITDGARAYAVDECKRAYGLWQNTASKRQIDFLTQLHHVAYWVFAGMRQILPSAWELFMYGELYCW